MSWYRHTTSSWYGVTPSAAIHYIFVYCRKGRRLLTRSLLSLCQASSLFLQHGVPVPSSSVVRPMDDNRGPCTGYVHMLVVAVLPLVVVASGSAQLVSAVLTVAMHSLYLCTDGGGG